MSYSEATQMPLYPEDKDVLSAQTLSTISDFYGIDGVISARRNTRGLVNTTYELGEDLFATIYSGRGSAQLEAVSEIANTLSQTVPIVRPLKGHKGYVLTLKEGPMLVCPRLPGKHYVGIQHTDKQAVPFAVHEALAAFYWELQSGLTQAPHHLKHMLQRPSRPNIGVLPARLPSIAKSLGAYAVTGASAKLKYPELVHDDMERQNILTHAGQITGLVDLDSVRQGDVLYEFGHMLFNFVFSDPEADGSVAELYIEQLIHSKMIEHTDIKPIYGYICQFAVSDVVDFLDVANNATQPEHTATNLELLVSQYEQALLQAKTFFLS